MKAADVARVKKPRCFFVYALAPEGVAPDEANRLLNEYVADPSRGLALYHDHFIGRPGGVAVFFAETEAQREALREPGALAGWQLAVHPLIYARSPSGFDEQIAYTLWAYRGADWEALQREQRPVYGSPRAEAETAREEC